jgi:hypothetical protein
LKILLVHQNFPGQYLHLARHWGTNASNEVIYITQKGDGRLTGVRNIVYKPQRQITTGLHHYLREVEAGTLNAQRLRASRMTSGKRASCRMSCSGTTAGGRSGI